MLSLARAGATFALALALALPAQLAGSSFAGAAVAPSAAPTPTVSHLLTNSLPDPLGIAAGTPRLSWQMDADRRGVTQRSYRIRVATSADRLADPDVWDSGDVASDRSVDVRYGGPALHSHTRYFWSVRVRDDAGRLSAWSEPATFETALDPSEWKADWIGADDSIGAEWTDYTIDLDVTLERDAFGVFFRGSNGVGYMWQLNEVTPGHPLLRPHVRHQGGGYELLDEVPLGDVDLYQRHHLRISVIGDQIVTSLDGTEVDRRTRHDYPGPGIVGFRQDGVEQAVVHDITVTNTDGKVLVDTHFPPGDDTFAGGTVLPSGGLRVTAGDIWLADPGAPLLRKEISIPDGKRVASARIYASARGLYELHLNGTKVGDEELAPGWTDYRKRIDYQAYDVTDLLHPGDNALGAELAKGWYAGHVAMFGGNQYGSSTSLIAQLRIEYADGSVDTIGTDDSWLTTPGPIKAADLLDGETYDGRRARALAGWDRPGYDAGAWDPVVVRSSDTHRLEPQTDQPVRVTEQRAARSIPSPTPGAYLYDMGQNMVGKVRVTLQGEPGQKVRIRYGEVLNPDGTLYTANLRTAKATDYYTLATDQPETYSPTFTFHGFRYVEITGVDTPPPASAVTGVVVGTDGAATSSFETSSALVNQLHSNITWGQRGNFLSIPTDTPARDERLGWTGDINVFARTAVYNMDSEAFLTKWLRDLRDAQRADGAFPSIAPVVPSGFDGGFGNTGWADAGVNVPWTLWQAYGDTYVIKQNYDAMTRYVDWAVDTSDGLLRGGGAYGDWLNLDDPTPGNVIGTAFLAKDARQLAQMAEAIGKDADAAKYHQLYRDVRDAFISHFVGQDGTVSGDSQTAYILAITNDLVPQDLMDAVAKNFAQTIERRDVHLSVGFLGVNGLLPALTKVGRDDLAYQLLENTDYPSWGYEIAKGATTLWERWNSIKPNGEFGDVGMNSFNHYAYGSVGEWMYRSLAGVSALKPGYKESLIAPHPGGDLDHASLALDTRYGTVESRWHKTSEGLTLDVTVPGNTTAQVRMPAPSRWAVTEGGQPAEAAEDVRFVRMEGDAAVFKVGSGHYEFAIDATLGHLGEARATVDGLSTHVEHSETLRAPVVRYLTAQILKLTEETGDAWDTYVAGDPTGAAAGAHRALSRTASLKRWIGVQQDEGRISSADAEELMTALDRVTHQLSVASGELVGAVASLLPPETAQLPGDTFRVRITVENEGTSSLGSLTSALDVPEGWTVASVGDPETAVDPGRTVTHDYDVTAPVGADPGTWPLSGTVSYRYQSSFATLPVSAEVRIVPAVVVDSVSVDPGAVAPGGHTTVTTVVANRADSARSGTLRVQLPDGWTEPAAQPFSLPAGGQATLTTSVDVPLSVTEGPASVQVSTGQTELERRTGSIDVVFSNPPQGVLDHVDLGDAASEQAHELSASPASGTSVEAGLTRRYTNSAVPGGWFEFRMRVPAGKPFVLRAVETYDHAQFKTYDVLVDGEVVHQRRYRRTDNDAGSLSYQFVVDRPDLTSDGVVTVRYQDVGADYDPSIADVWSFPAP